MKIAVPTWKDRVSPLMDAAGQMQIVDVRDNRAMDTVVTPTPHGSAAEMVSFLAERGVSVVICGAISRPLEALLQSRSIRVIPWVCGDASEVVLAFMSDRLSEARYAMPGCCRRRRGGGIRLRRRQRAGAKPTEEQ